ncbi:MAG TPA: hypothetical protein VGT41_01515 [Candidatus Babeliales bacterium]|nr:hypothetical protein [Candidatus Babeliales bacterium]
MNQFLKTFFLSLLAVTTWSYTKPPHIISMNTTHSNSYSPSSDEIISPFGQYLITEAYKRQIKCQQALHERICTESRATETKQNYLRAIDVHHSALPSHAFPNEKDNCFGCKKIKALSNKLQDYSAQTPGIVHDATEARSKYDALETIASQYSKLTKENIMARFYREQIRATLSTAHITNCKHCFESTETE